MIYNIHISDLFKGTSRLYVSNSPRELWFTQRFESNNEYQKIVFVYLTLDDKIIASSNPELHRSGEVKKLSDKFITEYVSQYNSNHKLKHVEIKDLDQPDNIILEYDLKGPNPKYRFKNIFDREQVIEILEQKDNSFPLERGIQITKQTRIDWFNKNY